MTDKQKRQYVKEYIRSLKAIEDAMEPYKEQRRELRSEFKENGWLNLDEIRAAVKAYRLHTGTIEIDTILDNLDIISGGNDDA
jgi:hypothetical protein